MKNKRHFERPKGKTYLVTVFFMWNRNPPLQISGNAAFF